MIETQFEFRNYVLKISPTQGDTQTAIVLFHGFPAEPVTDHSKEKNIDFGRYLCSELGITVYIPHYNGLGKNKGNEFSFVNSITDSIELVELLKTNYSSLSIIGHSWGGLVALNVIKKQPEIIDRVVLQSPFVKIPDSKNLRLVLEYLFSDLPHLTQSKSIDSYLLEFDEVRLNYNPFGVISNYENKISGLILHAERDDEVPLVTTEKLSEMLNWPYEVIDTNHGFWEKREGFFLRVKRFLSL